MTVGLMSREHRGLSGHVARSRLGPALAQPWLPHLCRCLSVSWVRLSVSRLPPRKPVQNAARYRPAEGLAANPELRIYPPDLQMHAAPLRARSPDKR